MKLTFAVIGSLVVASLVVSAAWSGNEKESTAKQQGSNNAKYSVVSTDAAHLIVTDNSSNTLYFYAVQAGGSPGDDLNLRGKIDLNAVGADVLKVGKTANEKNN